MATVVANPGPNRAMRRMQKMTRKHLTKAYSRGTAISGNWQKGKFGYSLSSKRKTAEQKTG